MIVDWKSLEDTEEGENSPLSESATTLESGSPSSTRFNSSIEADAEIPSITFQAPLLTVGIVSSRYRRWPNPNPSNEPNYADPSRNIFMLLQKQPLINHTGVPLKDITFPNSIPPPDDLDIRPIDSTYLTFFLTEVPSILGSDRFFPKILNSIFERSVSQPVLRHSILAVSSWIIDNRLGRPPLYTHHHLQRVLPVIQKAITELKINSAHILSVSFLSWLSLMTGDLQMTHRHLKGLFLMFIHAHHLSPIGEPLDNSDPVIMFLYRMSLRIDNTLAYRNFAQAYPPITDHEEYYRQWVRQIISSEEDLEGCIASFRIDDLTNRICHLHTETRQHREQSTSYDTALQRRAETLQADLSTWSTLPVIRRHISLPSSFSSHSDTKSFLHYPPYEIMDMVFAQMVLLHASLGIHLSIAKTGTLGPYPHSRYENAVQVCRIYAAIGTKPALQKTGQSRLINALWLSGLVLGSSLYPAGRPLTLITKSSVSMDIKVVRGDRSR